MMSSSKPKNKSVKFLLAPRPQRDPLAADYEAPQHVLIPKGGENIEEIRKKLPDLNPEVFVSKQETKVGMLERAHNADGLTFDTDLLEAMSKDFDFEDPNNILDDDFMDQAGGLIEDEGEVLDGEMSDLTNQLFEDEPEVITFGRDTEEDIDNSHDSDDYDIDQEKSRPLEKSNDKQSEAVYAPGSGKRLILFKKKVNKPTPQLPDAASTIELERQLNANFTPEAQRMLHLKNKLLADQDELADFNDDDSSVGDRSEAKSVFTNYSMTSSVIRRNQGLQQIDEHFERLYEKEYADDTEIGALDLNEVKGEELLSNIDQIRQLKQEVKEVRQRNHGDDYEPEIVSDHHKDAIIGDEPAAEDEDLVEVEILRRENNVDCESILTYNSNLYNHPKLIIEPRRRITSRGNSEIMEVDDRSRSDRGQSIASSRATILSKLSLRPDNETPLERRERKKALKIYRHERRQERKLNQQIFKSEHDNLMKQQRSNQPALKLA